MLIWKIILFRSNYTFKITLRLLNKSNDNDNTILYHTLQLLIEPKFLNSRSYYSKSLNSSAITL